MNTKAWYKSKTLWVNALAGVGCVVVGQYVTTEQWGQISTAVLAVANIVLRLTTNSGLDTGTDSGTAG